MSFAKSKYLNTWKQVDMKITDQGKFENFFDWSSFWILNESSKIGSFGESTNHFRSIDVSNFEWFAENQIFRRIGYFEGSFSNQIKRTKLLTMRAICDLLNLPVNRSMPTTPSPWSNISPILLKLFLIFIKVRVLTPHLLGISISHREIFI